MNDLETAVQSCSKLMNRKYNDHSSHKVSESKPVATMVERFVQSLTNANDSGSFDTSLEVKSIHPQRKRSKCLTELDRDDLVKFVEEFESRNKTQHLTVPKQDAAFDDEPADTDSDFESTDQEEYYDANDELKSTRSNSINQILLEVRTPENNRQPYQITEEDLQKRLSFKKPYNDEKNCKAARLLTFISSARKKMKHLKTASCNTSRNSSPLPQRSKLFERGYRHLHAHSDTEDDDGISTGSQLGSRNISPDSSFELQPPIVPTFKITPPHLHRQQQQHFNPAHSFARILRSSFHAKHASILRRSISNPDNFTVDDILKEGAKSKSEFIEAKTRIVRRGLGAAMIRNLDVLCETRKLLHLKNIQRFN